ncbi:MAG TPA: 30S ribosomal protein S6e [archaeon]|nr:30S ribosomal protein S6e [archaeon]
MPFRFVINEPKTRKSFQKDIEAPALMGQKIGDKFSGDLIGLGGFSLQITGGSDKEGFPMRPEIPGQVRKKVLITGPPGFHPFKEGQRKRKFVCGNTISERIMQVNCKVVEGEGDVGMILGIAPKEKKAEKPTEAKPAEAAPKEEEKK